MEKMRVAMMMDDSLQKLKTFIYYQDGHKSSINCFQKAKHTFRDELVIYNDLVNKGRRLVIPKALRADMKEKLHSTHMSIESSLRRARDCIY